MTEELMLCDSSTWLYKLEGIVSGSGCLGLVASPGQQRLTEFLSLFAVVPLFLPLFLFA